MEQLIQQIINRYLWEVYMPLSLLVIQLYMYYKLINFAHCDIYMIVHILAIFVCQSWFRFCPPVSLHAVLHGSENYN